MQIDLNVVEFLGKGLALQRTDSVLTRNRAFIRQSDLKDLVKRHQRPRSRISVSAGRDDRGVQIAVACMAESGDPNVIALGDLLNLHHGVRESSSRDRNIIE